MMTDDFETDTQVYTFDQYWAILDKEIDDA